MLIYQNRAEWDALTEDERTGVFGEVEEIWKELNESGEWVGGAGLGESFRAIRVRDGVPVVTDGPFIEAKEQLAGYSIFDCATEERAIEIAARWPDARYWGVELRPLIEAPE
jgi:hypothetical protein